MCAIAGILDLYYNESILQNMLRSMARRGPDGNGAAMTENCCLLHTRLAIIDPAGGQQPMQLCWKGKHYTLIYNGELYNTEELRSELEGLGHLFLTQSDTEVLLHACVQWGESCLQRLNGIFAFALWQREERKLFLARDPMGVKPLFYCRHKGGLIFASEIKTILRYPDVPRRLTQEGAGELLLLGPGRTPGSGVLDGILELEPGCCGVYRDGVLQIRRYWQLRDRIHEESFEETAEHVRYLVEDSIRRQTVSDVPLGTFLSGGLDSSLITAICAGNLQDRGQRLPVFSLDYQNNEQYFEAGKFQPTLDNSFIRLMHETLPVEPNWTVLTPEALLGALEEATLARDLPGMADVDFSLLLFCGEISQHVKVALSGECADEIFGGYPWYRDSAILMRQGFPWAQNTDRRAAYLHPGIHLDSREFVHSRYADTVAQSDILPENTPRDRQMKEMVNLNYRWFMQTLLDRKDRMSMYQGLEVRVPFCDCRIAQYLYGIPWEYKDYRNTEKGLLRHAMAGYLPDAVLWRKKSPYPKTYDPHYRELVSKALQVLLEHPQEPIFGIVDGKALNRLLQDTQPQPWYGQLMQAPQIMAYMLQLNFWLKHYGIIFS